MGSEGLSREASWPARPIKGGLLGSEGLSGEASWAAKPIREASWASKAYPERTLRQLSLSEEAFCAAKAYQGRLPGQLRLIRGGLYLSSIRLLPSQILSNKVLYNQDDAGWRHMQIEYIYIEMI